VSDNNSHQSKANVIIIVVCLVVIIIAGLAIALRKNSSTSTSVNPNSPVSLYLSPAKQTINGGADISVGVWANTNDKDVTAVQANLTYPSDMFEFVSIDSSGSAFALDAQSKGGDGKVSIARANTQPVSGNVEVAIVKLHALDKTGPAKVEFASGSAMVDSTTNKNVLETTVPATYTIK